MLTSNEILQKVNDCLDHLRYDRKPASLYEPMQYVIAFVNNVSGTIEFETYLYGEELLELALYADKLVFLRPINYK